jgi:glycosyltransferase involved in cell wall biosynthesis
MKRLRVVHLISGLEVGGAEKTLHQIALGLRDRGFDVTVASLTRVGPIGRQIAAEGVPVLSLGMRRGSPSPSGFLRLVGHLRRLSPDVLQTWLYHADLLGAVAGRAVGVPAIAWNLRTSKLDLSPYRRLSRWTLAACARLSRLPDVVIVNSEAGRDSHAGLGYRPRRWVVIPNGFDLDLFRPDPAARAAFRREIGAKDGEILVGLIARFDPAKDHGTFLRAAGLLARRRPDVRFLMVGEGVTVQNATLSGLIKAEGLSEKVWLLGLRDDLPRVYAGLDIEALSSRAEGLPNVVGEAMAAGVPCVVTDVGDARRMVGETGVVILPGDAEALAAGLERLVAEGAETRRRRGVRARQRVAEEYGLARIVDRYAELYQELGEAKSCAV